MNDTQDVQYLALELTKIKHQAITEKTERKHIMEDYWYFLESITEVFEKIAQVEELEKEIERLHGLLKVATDNLNHDKKLHRLIDVVNQCKGDMEPYVYECLMAEINLKTQ